MAVGERVEGVLYGMDFYVKAKFKHIANFSRGKQRRVTSERVTITRFNAVWRLLQGCTGF